MGGESFQHATIIGAGLLGGSIGLALKARGLAGHVAGVGRRRASLDEALRVGAIDSAHLDPADPAARSDLVILATPVGAFEPHLRAIRPVLRRGALVTDVGSTKAAVVRTAERVLGRGGPFVGSHPMAGSEKKGPAFADAALLAGATCIVTPTPHTPPGLLRRAERLWRALGMTTVRMTPAAHDRAAAGVSHLPHLLAGLLMLLPRQADLLVSAGGLRDMTRLAAGDPEVWRDILLTNRAALQAAVAKLQKALAQTARMLRAGDAAALERLLAAAKRRRDALPDKTAQKG